MAASQVTEPKFFFSFYNSNRHGRLHIEQPYLIKEHFFAATHTFPLPGAFCPVTAEALSILLKPRDSGMCSGQVSFGFILLPRRTWCEHIAAALC